MRRFVRRGLGLLGVVVAIPAAAQRSPDRPVTALEEPRANPVMPATLVPFTIGPEACRQGHVPKIELRVYNALTQPVATLRLRDRATVFLDGSPLKCGDYVAFWDGTIDGGARAASPGLYKVRLSVDGFGVAAKNLIFTPP